MSKVNKVGEAIALDDAVNQLSSEVDAAVDFIAEEFEPFWEAAERYYKGGTDLKSVSGRSQVVKTEVRDAIRNTLPSVMRVLCQSRKIVQYKPNSIAHSNWVAQQSEYVTSSFWANGGYTLLYSGIKNASKYRYSPIRCYYVESPDPERVTYTNAPVSLMQSLMGRPDVEDLEYKETDDPKLINFSFYKTYKHGKIEFECTPNSEFFMSRNCASIAEAEQRGVHGTRREVTVSEALELGLSHDDWLKLDTHDPEQNEHAGSSTERRRYHKRADLPEIDIMRHKFLLTMVYYATDLKGLGTAQLYKFWLGGTQYEYLDHDEVDFSEFELLQIDPEPHTFAGTSTTDLTINEQDTSTSLLRAVIDNAHAANNPRPVVNPDKTPLEDVTNTAIGAPIRSRSGEPIQFATVPFTGGQLMPVMQYLDLDIQNKVGITKAAQGLDPDALQSTDKQAVLNTISTSQGQAELIVRNVVETCLMPFFAKVLKLSIRHMDPMQIMSTRGTLIPVDLRMFDPDASAQPNVGLGTGEVMQKQQTLNFVLQKQEQYMQTFGYGNPFTSLDKVFNTIEDLLELGGIVDVGRYFSVVTPEVEEKLAARQAEAAKAQKAEQQDAQPIDPNRAYMAVEQGSQQIKQLELLARQREAEAKLMQQSTEAAERFDIERDRLVQERELKLLELQKEMEAERIARLQKENDSEPDKPTPSRSSATGSKKSS